jgi:hypothetical protein
VFVEIREFIGVFIGGVITLALVATAVNKNSTTASIAQAFTDGFANDIRAATFQSGGSSSGG